MKMLEKNCNGHEKLEYYEKYKRTQYKNTLEFRG
jgi:hypothetical protein